MTQAWITGAKGQLGLELLKTKPASVEISSFDKAALDITQPTAIEKQLARHTPDVVINAAAYTAVDRAESESSGAFAVNEQGVANLAQLSKKHGFRLFHISTDFVFDGAAHTPYPPSAATNPLSVYGKSKRAGELALERAALPNSLLVRTSWLYSMHPGFQGKNFVKTILRLLQTKEELKVVADQTGSPTWARTLARFLWSLVQKPELRGIYHWADAGSASWFDFAVQIQKEALAKGWIAKPIPILPISTSQYPTPAVRPAYSVLETTASHALLETPPLHWKAALQAAFSEI